jgi:uncharacterized cofD-like protein
MADGSVIEGESHITEAGGRIKTLSLKPAKPKATPEAIEAIHAADLIILGPGSLYTSIIPNLLVEGIPQAIRDSNADKIYVTNVLTQLGETTGYSVGDHVEAILSHSATPSNLGYRLMEAVLVNDQTPDFEGKLPADIKPVTLDNDRLRELGVVVIKRNLLSQKAIGHHDSDKLAKSIMLWHMRHGRKQPIKKVGSKPSLSATGSSTNGKYSPTSAAPVAPVVESEIADEELVAAGLKEPPLKESNEPNS